MPATGFGYACSGVWSSELAGCRALVSPYTVLSNVLGDVSHFAVDSRLNFLGLGGGILSLASSNLWAATIYTKF